MKRNLLLSLLVVLFSSLLKAQDAQSIIELTTQADTGDYIMLSINSEGAVEIEGAELKFGGMAEVKSSKIKIRGNISGIDCSDAYLTHLDVSKAPALNSIWCDNNSLTELEVSTLPNLKILHCVNNHLKTIDVSRNLLLEEFDCSENELETVDVTYNAKLNRLLVFHNLIETVDVSKNPLLIGLDMSENRLNRLDVSANKMLETIYCNGNNLNGEAMKAFISSLPDRNDREEQSHLFVIDTKNGNEKNAIFAEQVQKALTKKWQVLDYSDGDNDGAGIDYAGTAPAGVDDISADALRFTADCNVLTVKGLRKNASVKLFSVNGRLINALVSHNDGNLVFTGVNEKTVLLSVAGKVCKIFFR